MLVRKDRRNRRLHNKRLYKRLIPTRQLRTDYFRNDGLLAGWKNGAMLMSNDLFIVQFGNFGIKVNTSGFQVKTRNKQYWHDLND